MHHHRSSNGASGSSPDEHSASTSSASDPHSKPIAIKWKENLVRSLFNSNATFPVAESSQETQAGGQISDPLGLHLVCDNSDPSGDLIFVHGLGGTSRKTWCWGRNVDYFWPAWLAEEDALSSYRIFTFGYNSNFKGAGTNLNIIDFAKELLFQMLVFSDRLGKDRPPVGRWPIVFVAHSMGGLVVKKAYVLGKNDKQYANVISNINGIVFLATPHRGAHYAKILNNILSSAPLGGPPKAYIADLDTQSRTLQDINEQFRTVCDELSLVSFYETRKTSVGLFKAMIVEKESGILGYPQEMSSPLNADHHTICKFKNRDDGGYTSVKNILKLWASRLSSLGPPSKYQQNFDCTIAREELLQREQILEKACCKK